MDLGLGLGIFGFVTRVGWVFMLVSEGFQVWLSRIGVATVS